MASSLFSHRSLSVVFPAGSAIANGDKSIEVRRWIPDVRHDEDVLIVENRVFLNQDGEIDKRGVARALVKVREIRPFRPSDVICARAKRYEDGDYAWQLTDVRPVRYPGHVVAARGIYDLNLDPKKLIVHQPYDDASGLRLCLPYVGFKDAFIDACISENEDTFEVRSQIELVKRDFSAFVDRRLNYANGEKIIPGLVPWTEYWLMFEDECVGMISFRHHLNSALERLGGHIGYSIRPEFRRRGFGTRALALTLQRARVFGLTEVLVTCDDNNVGSYKIIEANGGELIDKIKNESRPVLTRRYKIRLHV